MNTLGDPRCAVKGGGAASMGQEQPRVEARQPATGPRRIKRVPMRNLKWWAVGIAALSLVLVVGVIIYGYRTKPGWVGVSGKTVWDYLELLIVPAALAIGAAWLTRQQRERELAVEDQRAKDEALQTYINTMGTRLEDLRTAFHDYQKAVFDIKEQE